MIASHLCLVTFLHMIISRTVLHRDVLAFLVNIKIQSTSNFTEVTLRLRNQSSVTQLKNDWEWQYKPHPKTLLQYLQIALIAMATKHTGKSTE